MNKKTLLTAIFSAALLTGIGNASAQEPLPEPRLDGRPPHHERMERVHHRLADRLKLTDEQKKQAEEIRKAGREKIKPLMDEMKQVREKMDAARQENMKEFEKILNDEQKSELAKIKSEKKARFESRRHRRDERPLPPRPEEQPF